jgi:glycosyltransferase involved in cell wall biosynthesis
VPSIIIPHAHLDDDFYHFPDFLESAKNASLVLAVPKVACQFLSDKGCNVRYMPAGCDTLEEFSQQDVESFRRIFPSNKPFVLVLGRKAGAKGYRKIINAVDQLNCKGEDIHVVLIGPDDDGLPVESSNASYLGRQPRNIVRGALMSCVALCNMSTSESFGIVLLEAWLAGKPVIVNRNCAAFHDMAEDKVNSLMVVEEDLMDAIQDLFSKPQMQLQLAMNGKMVAEKFDWVTASDNFLNICNEFVR